jgi:PST family polysaccharide transporter
MGRADLKKRARFGVVMLALRTVVLQVATLGGTVVLARLLDPADFGVFAICQFGVTFFHFFGDAGLGGALIQKKGKPSQAELSSVWHVQFAIAVIVVIAIFFGAGSIRLVWDDLPQGAEWVFRALSLGLLLTVLRVIPSILMERELLFGRLAAVEVASTLGFYGGSVAFALAGHTVWALVAGTLLQAVLSTVLVLFLRPWKPSLVFDKAALAPIFRFGIPFQVKTLISFVNGAIVPVYAGSMLGSASLGLIQWAQSTAYFPLHLVRIMGRVTFPLYSRLQDDQEAFAETLGRSIQICAFGTFFFVGLFLGMGRNVIHIIFTDKWLPALPMLYIYATAITIGFISPVAAAALDASGRPSIVAKLATGWTLLNWIVVLIATPKWGMIGFAAGYCVHVVVGNIAILVVVLYVIPGVRTTRRLLSSIGGGLVVWGVGYYVGPHAMTVFRFIGATALCLAVYAAVLFVLDRQGFRDAIALVPLSRKKKPAEASDSEPAGQEA